VIPTVNSEKEEGKAIQLKEDTVVDNGWVLVEEAEIAEITGTDLKSGGLCGMI